MDQATFNLLAHAQPDLATGAVRRIGMTFIKPHMRKDGTLVLPTRETASAVRDRSRLRPLIIELGPHAVTLRPKHTRYRVTVPWDCIYSLGTKLKAEETRGVRAGRRKKR